MIYLDFMYGSMYRRSEDEVLKWCYQPIRDVSLGLYESESFISLCHLDLDKDHNGYVIRVL